MNSNMKTESAIKLNEAALSQLGNNVRVPQYDRQQITHGIIHIGVGGFHRAHQALYLDNYFQKNPQSDWGICGVGLLEFDQRMQDALNSQDRLYTLVERSPESDNARVIGSIIQYLFAPDNRQAVIDALADPQCRIVTLTITEGGYYYIEGSGEFDGNHPTNQWYEPRGKPRSVFRPKGRGMYPKRFNMICSIQINLLGCTAFSHLPLTSAANRD
jgi:mannitol 2-dehydrogenase